MGCTISKVVMITLFSYFNSASHPEKDIQGPSVARGDSEIFAPPQLKCYCITCLSSRYILDYDIIMNVILQTNLLTYKRRYVHYIHRCWFNSEFRYHHTLSAANCPARSFYVTEFMQKTDSKWCDGVDTGQPFTRLKFILRTGSSIYIFCGLICALAQGNAYNSQRNRDIIAD